MEQLHLLLRQYLPSSFFTYYLQRLLWMVKSIQNSLSCEFAPGDTVQTLNGTKMWVDTIHIHKDYVTYTLYDGKDGYIQLDAFQVEPYVKSTIGFETNKKELPTQG